MLLVTFQLISVYHREVSLFRWFLSHSEVFETADKIRNRCMRRNDSLKLTDVNNNMLYVDEHPTHAS